MLRLSRDVTFFYSFDLYRKKEWIREVKPMRVGGLYREIIMNTREVYV